MKRIKTNIENPVFLDLRKAKIKKLARNEVFTQLPWNPKFYLSNHGRLYNATYKRMLKPQLYGNVKLKNNLYHSYKIMDENGTYKNYRAHRLVAEIYVHNPDPVTKTEIHHKNGRHLDNVYTNLKYVTTKEHRALYTRTSLFIYDIENGNFRQFKNLACLYRGLNLYSLNPIHNAIYKKKPQFEFFNGLDCYVIDELEYKGLPLHLGIERKENRVAM